MFHENRTEIGVFRHKVGNAVQSFAPDDRVMLNAFPGSDAKLFFLSLVISGNHFIDKFGIDVRHIRRQQQSAVTESRNRFKPQVQRRFNTGTVSGVVNDVDVNVLQKFFHCHGLIAGNDKDRVGL